MREGADTKLPAKELSLMRNSVLLHCDGAGTASAPPYAWAEASSGFTCIWALRD